ncbi:MipA/OmpV family protein [Kiloniella sp. EL199]|uniref:MipA/OmpV family protein n=1 Tax=Kiloniella sp. EL199 TaxID=2107581 RepID=UPI001C1FE018|nr:MipA/OmpV family protein [Kiloniella sp. EL199]
MSYFLQSKPVRFVLFTSFISLGLMSPAIADGQTTASNTESGSFVDAALSDWNFTIGAGAGFGPDYEGSDDYGVGAMPILEASWRDDTFFVSVDRGIGATLLRSEHFSGGVSLNYDWGRDEDDNSALKGLGDVEAGLAGSAFAEIDLGMYALGLDVTQDLSGEDKGLLANFSAEYRHSFFDERLWISAGPTVSWASEDYMQSYFGVDSKQASRSRYNQHDVDAGFKDVGFNVGAMYSFDENWAMTGSLGYARLLGDAADSPFVESENQVFGGLAITYHF